jgi:hypothetical protein
MTQRIGPKRPIEEYRRLEKERYWNGEYPNKIMSTRGLISDSWYIDDYGRPDWKKEKARQNTKIWENRKKAGAKTKGKVKRTNKIETDQHFPLFYDVLDNPEFRNGLMKKGWFRTYVWLGRYIVRAEMKNDPHRLYQRYYQKGMLASCVPTRMVAKALKIGKSTVSDHIKALSDDGIIETATIQANKSFDGQRYVVCIFGNHTDGKEHWFIQDRFKVSENPLKVA